MAVCLSRGPELGPASSERFVGIGTNQEIPEGAGRALEAPVSSLLKARCPRRTRRRVQGLDDGCSEAGLEGVGDNTGILVIAAAALGAEGPESNATILKEAAAVRGAKDAGVVRDDLEGGCSSAKRWGPATNAKVSETREMKGPSLLSCLSQGLTQTLSERGFF